MKTMVGLETRKPGVFLGTGFRCFAWATVGRLPSAWGRTGVSTKSGHSEAVSGTSWLRLVEFLFESGLGGFSGHGGEEVRHLGHEVFFLSED